eukprot:scaffold347566_cov31-Prasinocladus_malaysianus.AAC.1
MMMIRPAAVDSARPARRRVFQALEQSDSEESVYSESNAVADPPPDEEGGKDHEANILDDHGDDKNDEADEIGDGEIQQEAETDAFGEARRAQQEAEPTAAGSKMKGVGVKAGSSKKSLRQKKAANKPEKKSVVKPAREPRPPKPAKTTASRKSVTAARLTAPKANEAEPPSPETETAGGLFEGADEVRAAVM